MSLSASEKDEVVVRAMGWVRKYLAEGKKDDAKRVIRNAQAKVGGTRWIELNNALLAIVDEEVA